MHSGCEIHIPKKLVRTVEQFCALGECSAAWSPLPRGQLGVEQGVSGGRHHRHRRDRRHDRRHPVVWELVPRGQVAFPITPTTS